MDAGLVDEVHAIADLGAALLDQFLDFLGGIGRPAGQVTHFLGNHGKALAGFTGPRRLDAGIECQQVGLEGDVVDDLENLRNPGGLLDPPIA
jgi:hypothetical protein